MKNTQEFETLKNGKSSCWTRNVFLLKNVLFPAILLTISLISGENQKKKCCWVQVTAGELKKKGKNDDKLEQTDWAVYPYNNATCIDKQQTI